MNKGLAGHMDVCQRTKSTQESESALLSSSSSYSKRMKI